MEMKMKSAAPQLGGAAPAQSCQNYCIGAEKWS